jgi:hypothetical protein
MGGGLLNVEAGSLAQISQIPKEQSLDYFKLQDFLFED